MDIIINQSSYSIIDINSEELKAIYNAILHSLLPDKRLLNSLKTKIDERIH